MNDDAVNEEHLEPDDRAADEQASDEQASEEREDAKLAESAQEAAGDEQDVAEKPGSTKVPHERADQLADEWGEESFPGSDPPAHY